MFTNKLLDNVLIVCYGYEALSRSEDINMARSVVTCNQPFDQGMKVKSGKFSRKIFSFTMTNVFPEPQHSQTSADFSLLTHFRSEYTKTEHRPEIGWNMFKFIHQKNLERQPLGELISNKHRYIQEPVKHPWWNFMQNS